jgi:hypothetical protein
MVDSGAVARFSHQSSWSFDDLGGVIVDSPVAMCGGVFGRAPDGSLSLIDSSGSQNLGGMFD